MFSLIPVLLSPSFRIVHSYTRRVIDSRTPRACTHAVGQRIRRLPRVWKRSADEIANSRNEFCGIFFVLKAKCKFSLMPRVFSGFISAYRALVTAALYYRSNLCVRINRFFQAVRRSLLRQSTSGNELTQCLWSFEGENSRRRLNTKSHRDYNYLFQVNSYRKPGAFFTFSPPKPRVKLVRQVRDIDRRFAENLSVGFKRMKT